MFSAWLRSTIIVVKTKCYFSFLTRQISFKTIIQSWPEQRKQKLSYMAGERVNGAVTVGLIWAHGFKYAVYAHGRMNSCSHAALIFISTASTT